MGRELLLVLLAAAGCTQAGSPQAGRALAPSASSATPTLAASASAPPRQASRAPRAVFVSAMRALDWPRATKAFEKLPRSQQAEPAFRYARAYCAHRLHDHAGVLGFTDDLASDVPLVSAEIARMRAVAHLETGAHEQAAQYFAKQPHPEDLLKAARALRELDQLDRARRVVDQALALATKQNDGQELLAQIRAARVDIAEQKKQAALQALDLRWLALSAPTTPPAVDADQELEQIKGQRLSKHQRYDRAMAFAKAGRVEDTETELQRLAKAPGPAISQAEFDYALAWAHYSTRNYEQAAELFDRAIASGTKQRLEASFYAARALSRADKDREAIERYLEYAKTYPKSGYAENARYLVGRLHYILGDWQEAAKHYNLYLGAFGKRGRFQKTARYELAVTRLAQKEYGKALSGFKRLVSEEKSARLKLRYQLLEAIALAGSNDKPAAVKAFRSIIAESPLSFSALAAHQRLLRLGERPPPVMPAAEKSAKRASLEVELPAKVQLLAKVGLDHLAEAELREHEVRLRQKYRPREYESLCLAYSTLTVAARRYAIGQQAARWSLLTKPVDDQNRWLWECIYPRPYDESVAQVSREFEVPSELIYAVMRQESGFRPQVVSPAQAVGLMQMIEPTARRVMNALDKDYDARLLEIPAHNIRFGGYYLRRLLGTFGGNVALSVAAYNAGPKAVSHWLESGEKLDLDVFVARIPYRETRGYVERVVENWARYAYLAEGRKAVPALKLEIAPGLRAGPDAY